MASAAVPKEKESRLKGLRERLDVPTRFDLQPSGDQNPTEKNKHRQGTKNKHHHQRHHTHHATSTSSAEIKHRWRSAGQRVSYQESVNFFIRQDASVISSSESHEQQREMEERATGDETDAIINVEGDLGDIYAGTVQPRLLDLKSSLDVIGKPSSKLLFANGDREQVSETEESDEQEGEAPADGDVEEGKTRKAKKRRRRKGSKDKEDLLKFGSGNWNRLQNRQRSFRAKAIEVKG
jgi:hypothetical protein